MPNHSIEQLLENANAYVGQGEWSRAIQTLKEADGLQPANPAILTAIGMCFVQTGQAVDALPYVQRAFALQPRSAEAANNLGIVYTLLGDLAKGEHCFKTALEQDGDNHSAWKNLAQVYLRQNDKLAEGVQILASIVQSDPDDIEALSLLASCYEAGEEYQSARTLYERILQNDPQNQEALLSMQRIGQVVEESEKTANQDRSRKLAALKNLRKPAAAAPTNPGGEPELPQFLANLKRYRGVAWYGVPELMRTNQIKVWAGRLAQADVETKLASEFLSADLDRYEFFIFSQPNLSATLINGVQACMSAEKGFAVDLDHDYFSLPDDSPTYPIFGKGNPQAVQALEIMLREAQWVSASSEELRSRLRPYAKKAELLPPTWDRSNPTWKKNRPGHKTYNLGWMGTAADQADLQTIQAQITTFLNRHADAMLVLAGDPTAYQLFQDVAESQILFDPAATYGDDLPVVFSQFDVLLAPHRATPYNQAESFHSLMYAGIVGIPWLASAIPAYQAWAEGGRLLDQPAGWLAEMENLYQDRDEGKTLAQAGQQKAANY